MFEKYYKQHLAKRLLHGKTSSDDAGEGLACLLRVLALPWPCSLWYLELTTLAALQTRLAGWRAALHTQYSQYTG